MNYRLNRRTLLQASGVSLALPLLESMRPLQGAATDAPPKRMVFVCTTLGLHPPLLWPQTPGADYESTPYLELLKDHQQDFTLFSGLSHEDQTGRQPHDSEMTWLTSARKPGMGGFRNTISVDQLAATRLGYVTRYPSLSLGTAKAQSQSYTSGGVMIPAQTSPSRLFAQLFLQGKPAEVQTQKRKLDDGRSILDELGEQTKVVRRQVSGADNQLLTDFLDSVRAAEATITEVQGWLDKPKPQVAAEPPADIPDLRDLIGRAQLLMDLVPLIVQTDSTRVVSVMIQDHFVVPQVAGVTGNHHNLSHHGQDRSKIAQLEKIETEILGCFGSLLGQMKEKPEQGGTLLDNTSILFGSNLGNANAHHARNLPVFLAGGGFQHGRYVAQKQGGDAPLCNLFVTMLNQAGLPTESFGQSNGTLSW
jgi:hypothetical protein